MLVKELDRVEPVQAADYSELRELLHPDRDPVPIRHSLAHAVIEPGQSSLRHRLKAVEVYYFLSGRGLMHVGDEVAPVGPGSTVAVPAGQAQWVDNPGHESLTFLCIVDPPWQETDEETLENSREQGHRPD
ncbi:MAG: cupin domain-containing protein [Candidatus Eisenbacteria bacterium]|nr:cupin domain-containing protein [Candidatus Eisenbacteria bacterium]